MRVRVCGIGIISAIGDNVDRTFASLRDGKGGVAGQRLLRSVHDVPLGEVLFTNGELIGRLGLDRKSAYSRTALLGMWAAAQALADSGIKAGGGIRVGLVSSTSVAGMDMTEKFFEKFSADPSGGALRLVVSHECRDSTEKIAAYCGITEFRTTLSTACSSAANAIMLGARLIKSGVLDCVVAGGTDALSRFTLNGFNSLMILDRGKCRPFDASRSGLNLGEGAGYVVLARDGIAADKEYCRLSGYANANDAFHQTASSSEGRGAYLAMKNAVMMSGVHPGGIGYINAHGTGTPNNDSSEAAAIGRLYGEYGCAIPPVSSTKPYTGHTLAAAGGIEAVISVLALDRGVVFPNLNLAGTMPGAPFEPDTEYRESAGIKNVMSNSFGFGGNNSTLIFSR